MSTTSMTAASTLEGLLMSGAFASQAADDIDRTFRHGTRDTFYSKALIAEGRAEAERQLTEWDERNHFTRYASCIESITLGIVSLAKVKDDSLVDITACTPPASTLFDDRYGGPRNKFILFNTEVPGCGCMQPVGSDIFGPYGALGLKAVIIETGYSRDGLNTHLSLVLPAWGTGRYPSKPGQIVLARITTTGLSSGERFSPYVRTDEGVTDFTDADAYLRHMLGMKSVGDQVNASWSGSSIDQAIGFPGAEDYLAAKLPELGDYFAALAEKIAEPHKH